MFEEKDFSEIAACPHDWANYTSAEEAPEDVRAILDKMVERDWAIEFEDYEHLVTFQQHKIYGVSFICW